ncbi:MAG: polysaccharide biosynthesis/export family protein, partial [Candidatus Sulfotelmatobacter sp.]
MLSVPALATAQQRANTSPNTAPSELPAAQTPEQAAVSASGNPGSVAKADNATKGASNESVKLGPGDLIEINVYNVPELASKARVSNAGDVYLPLIDYVHVDGLTQEEAQTVLEKRLSDGGFVRSPHVTIFVDEAASQGVTILGEVGKPGIYPDTADRKLYEVISQAGGFSQSASKKISIIRRNQAEPIHVELPRNLADDTSANVEILPGDTITVPRAPIIYVVGDVGRPSGL